MRERIIADGATAAADNAYIDAGHSGSSLVRPALERLRDAVAAGDIDRLYVLAPDRLARRHAHQALLMEEFRRAGVAVAFLNRPIGAGPEDDLLLQIQGVDCRREVCRRLQQAGCRTRSGATRWGASTLHGMIENPADTSMAMYGRFHAVEPNPRLHPVRNHASSSRPTTRGPVPSAEWVAIPVPLSHNKMIPDKTLESQIPPGRRQQCA